MKKLMIAAVAAAMTGVASAAVCVENECIEDAGFTAYKLVVSLKTTAVKQGTLTKADECDDDCTCRYYYTQKTQKLAGYAYGEAECSGCQMLGDDLTLVAWNTTTKEPLTGADLALFLGRYEKTGKKAEAYGALTWDNDAGENSIALAGFGAMYIDTVQDDPCEEAECYTFIKNLSGNAAGYLAREESECDIYEFDCCDEAPVEGKAASGTWKLVYDKSVAKKLAKGMDPSNLCPAYVSIDDDAGTVTIED